MRFFLLLGLFFAVVWLIRGGRRHGVSGPAAPTPAARQAAAEQVVACAHCGLHLPQSEAVSGAADWFCSEAHRIAHDAARTPP